MHVVAFLDEISLDLIDLPAGFCWTESNIEGPGINPGTERHLGFYKS